MFPLTLTASSTTGLNLDLSIPDLLQSDLSVNFANGSSVNLSLLSGKNTATEQSRIADVLGTITAVSGTQVNVTTALGDLLVLNTGSSTTYNYPASVCSANNSTCLATGQVIDADLSMLGSGALAIDSLSFIGSSGSQWIEGFVLGTSTSGATPTAQVIVQRIVNASSLSAGEVATVSEPAGTAYLIGSPGITAPTGGTFVSAADLLPGQEVIASVGTDLAGGSVPTFSTASIYLEPSQLLGVVGAVDTANSSLQLTGLSGLLLASHQGIQQIEVQTVAATLFSGFSAASFSAISAGQFVAVRGPLFNTIPSLGYPTLSATDLRARESGN